ncbi:carbohydrate ABC transporter substrate-binding protein, CUT1 family [Frankineae bacterium MT45]|nr:carbohydrate ABC transporter substrate-binding protein, CUT1 family [Frankineae bacterium MT45]
MSGELPNLAGFNPGRRTFLKGMAAGIAGIGAIPLLDACTGGSSGSSGSSASKTTTLGSSASDDVPKKAIAGMVSAFEASSGDKVTINTKAHNDFQNQINSYLQGSPDDGFTWFAGYRMKYYASKGLVAPIDDVWEKIGADNFSEGIIAASTGDDGKKYFVPNYNYPWAVFYRKSVFAAKGYEVPTTWDAYKALAVKMQKDGLIPIAFADKDGWPAMGTFDYLNMRLNGYQFHIDLMAHKETWDQQKVKDVFDEWKAILPYTTPGALGLTWEEAAGSIANGKAGMYLLGSFVTQQFTDPAVLADIDFFPFPALAEANGQDAIEAPIDGFMLSKKGGDNGAARAMLEYFGSADGQNAYAKLDPSNVATNKKADTSTFTPIQAKAQKVISEAKNISQFLDRDALPAFANNTMIPALQTFLKDGNFDTKNVEAQAKTLYAQQ